MSAIFTLNTRRGHVVRVSFQRSCPSRHATIGRTPVNGSHRDKESRRTQRSLGGVRRNDFRFELCGRRGTDSCSSRGARRSLRLRVLCVIGSAACSSPPWSRARRMVRTGQCNGSRRGLGGAEHAENAEALRQTLPDFLVHTRETHSLAKCLVERQDPDPFEMFRVAS